MALLPGRIARAAVDALANLEPATFSHAVVPCEGIGLNRERDRDAPPLDEVLRDDWRPRHPELTDTTCRVVRVDAAGDGIRGAIEPDGLRHAEPVEIDAVGGVTRDVPFATADWSLDDLRTMLDRELRR
jgi:hypothetical protein